MYPILADLDFFSKEELDRVCKKGGIPAAFLTRLFQDMKLLTGLLAMDLGSNWYCRWVAPEGVET